MVVNFPYVDLRNPGVGINNSEDDFIRRNCQFIEVKFLDMFNTPANVTGFPLLLVLSYGMESEAYLQKSVFELLDEVMCLDI